MGISPATIAAIRFGTGLGPRRRGSSSGAALLAGLEREREKTDTVAPLARRLELLGEARAARLAMRAGAEDAQSLTEAARRGLEALALEDQRTMVARPVAAEQGFFERLVLFWTDHFTVSARNRQLAALVPDMIETAIRPHVTGKFADMLRAVVTHPAMLVYLDQAGSVGPDSPAGRRRGRGLNENLAREVLELHTLGVGGPYGQGDVLALAEVLTGLSVDAKGFQFRPGFVQPGAETVLGKAYGGGPARPEDIFAVLDDLAGHPATVRHLAHKLVVHFVGSTPDEGHVAAVADALGRDGRLMDAYAALVDHPAAWRAEFAKIKPPFDFVVSALRALGARRSDIEGLDRRTFRGGLIAPMLAMGQRPFAPPGPDGWPEAPETWITASGLAARIRWAQAFAERRAADRDPARFLHVALGDAAGPLLGRAVAGAETRAEGIALILASPEFNRR